MPPHQERATERAQERATGARLVAAFAAVYILWGSTYLAMRVGIETIPPFFMLGARFLIAGGILYAWIRARGNGRANLAEWRVAAVTGLLTLGGGTGAVVWAETRVPSGIAALLAAVVPLWMVLLDWLLPGGKRPTVGVMAGVVLGLVGLVMLVGPGAFTGHGQVDGIGALVLLLGSISWAVGTVFNRHGAHPASAQTTTALQMLAAGAALVLLAVLTGELAHWNPAGVSGASLLAVGYLVVFGSLVGFSAYILMVRSTSAAKASTYAYVNPVVALFLGAVVLGERITSQTLVAAAVILASVALITLTAGERDQDAERAEEPQLAEG